MNFKQLFLMFSYGGALLVAGTHPAHGQFQYVDVTSEAGISGYTMQPGKGGSVSAADFDDDGDIDLFAPTADGIPNRLYRNDGGTFVEIAEEAGLASLDPARASLWFDYDGDHRLDLIVGGDCHFPGELSESIREPCDDTLSLHLYRQVDNAQFVDVTTEAGITTGYIIDNFRHRGGISAGDINNDGFLDLIFAIWQGGARVLLNGGDESFTDITQSSGLDPFGFPLNYYQHMLHDFNGDGYLDFFTARDGGRNHLWVNQQDNTFVNVAGDANVDSFWNEMGVTLGDYDNDGDFDIFVTNIEIVLGPTVDRHHVLYRNQTVGEIYFEEVSVTAGVAWSTDDWQVGWGCTFHDADNDGLLDLAVTNGMILDQFPWAVTDQSVFFRNLGGDPPVFANISDEVGFNDTLLGSSLVAFDYDRDGRLDLAQTVQSTESFNGEISRIRLLRNEPDGAAPAHNYLVVKPRMAGPNHRAIGAVVRVQIGELVLSRLITASNSFMGQEPAEAHFGLGSAEIVDEVIIQWPDGTEKTISNVAANQVLTIENTFPDGEEGESEGEEGTLNEGEGEREAEVEAEAEGNRDGEGEEEGEGDGDPGESGDLQAFYGPQASVASSVHSLQGLRNFRDGLLVGTKTGDAMVSTYYSRHTEKTVNSVLASPSARVLITNLVYRPLILFMKAGGPSFFSLKSSFCQS